MNSVYIILLVVTFKAVNGYEFNATSANFDYNQYLEGVKYELKYQNWTKEELPCLGEILRWIINLQNFTMWTVWDWNSFSSQPEGLLSGSLYSLGNFDQCMTSPWKTQHLEMKSQYCLATVVLDSSINKTKRLDEIEPYGNAMEMILHDTPNFRPLKQFTWGVCMPANCEQKSVERFVGVLLGRSHLAASADLKARISVTQDCQRPDQPKKFDAAFYAYMTVIGMFIIINFVLTYLNNRNTSGNGNAILKAFCLKENSKDLLKVKSNGLETMYAIRFITIVFIVLSHVNLMVLVGPVSNGIEMDQIEMDISWFAMFGVLMVETFFLMSGLLTTKTLLGIKDSSFGLRFILLIILRRYIRAVIGMFIIINFIFTHLNNRITSGNGNSILRAFCLKENYKDLLNVKSNGLETMYAIRFITIVFVVMSHVHLAGLVGPVSNGIEMDQNDMDASWFGVFGVLTVDTFFLMSGLLATKTLLETKDPSFGLRFIPLIILRRYIRLVGGLAIIVLFMAVVFPHIGSGPLWNLHSDLESGYCRQNWWINLLMLSNYIGVDRMCLISSYYVACDFHYFCVAVTLYAIYKKRPNIGKICTLTITGASIIAPGIITYAYDFTPVQYGTYESVLKTREDLRFSQFYIKSHTRAASYFIGVLGGYFYEKYRSRENIKISKRLSLLYAGIASTIMILVALVGMSFRYRKYAPLEGYLYAAVNRPIFAAAQTLLIMTLEFGQLPLASRLLRWHSWAPLSRMAYGVYLIHFTVILRNVMISRNPTYYDHFINVLTAIGTLGISLVMAFLMWLFYEAPINNLFTVLVSKIGSKQQNNNANDVKLSKRFTTANKVEDMVEK